MTNNGIHSDPHPRECKFFVFSAGSLAACLCPVISPIGLINSPVKVRTALLIVEKCETQDVQIILSTNYLDSVLLILQRSDLSP